MRVLVTGHGDGWWAEFLAVSDTLDRAYLLEGLGDLISPRIQAPLLRREVRNTVDVVIRHLERPAAAERAEAAGDATDRLARTLARIDDRSTGSAISTDEAAMLLKALRGDYAGCAADAEHMIGATRLQRLFVTALRLERFDIPLTLRLLDGGQTPAQAVVSGHLIGRYSWWPSWLLRIVTERALAGTLDPKTIEALDRCAYAELTPTQAVLARKLLSGNERLLDTAAERLISMGEPDAALSLRHGDLNAVALAARLVPL
jgi:hypothetical protein